MVRMEDDIVDKTCMVESWCYLYLVDIGEVEVLFEH